MSGGYVVCIRHKYHAQDIREVTANVYVPLCAVIGWHCQLDVALQCCAKTK